MSPVSALYRCRKCNQERELYGDNGTPFPAVVYHYCRGEEEPQQMDLRFITELKDVKK